MSLNITAYRNLEQRFREQVLKDRPYADGWGVYLPFGEPKSRVDYIFVGMEPSGDWYEEIEDGEKQVEEGKRNGAPDRFTRPIHLFLLQPGQTYHLTDVSKGAMPVKAAGLNRERRYKEWYPLLLEEIEIVCKPSASVFAVGRKVEALLKRHDLEGKTGRTLHHVPHYSYQAGGHFKTEAERDLKGFQEFTKSEHGGNIPITKERQIFVYKKRFEAIRDSH